MKIALTVMFFFCVLFANFYAVRKMERYGLDLLFYDRLSVAYDIGSAEGMEKELTAILSNNSMPRVSKLARQFQSQLPGIEDPQGYLKNIVSEKRNTVMMLKNLRTAAIFVMLLLFTIRLLMRRKK
ncbi:MAG: hypothetical protein WC532_07060 [Candidatus Omnitrophota bacterium]